MSEQSVAADLNLVEIPARIDRPPRRHGGPPSKWNQELIDHLTQRWKDGASASTIAGEMGVTRNTVIGKAHRLGLESRKARAQPPGGVPSPPRRVRMKMNPRPLTGANHIGTPLPLPTATPLPPKCEPVDIEALQNHHCRYIVSGDGEETLYCGAQREHAGVPYCAYHVKRCYNFPKT